jgi:hypothetical protein
VDEWAEKLGEKGVARVERIARCRAGRREGPKTVAGMTTGAVKLIGNIGGAGVFFVTLAWRARI